VCVCVCVCIYIYIYIYRYIYIYICIHIYICIYIYVLRLGVNPRLTRLFLHRLSLDWGFTHGQRQARRPRRLLRFATQGLLPVWWCWDVAYGVLVCGSLRSLIDLLIVRSRRPKTAAPSAALRLESESGGAFFFPTACRRALGAMGGAHEHVRMRMYVCM